MDIAKTTEPRSDQINFDDVANKTVTVTVSEVKRGSAEQPVEIHLVEYPGRPFKPSKSMRRVLVAAWGSEASAYKGRRMTLYGDPTVKFGGVEVGGIRISHLSHLGGPQTIALTVTRGKRSPFVVQPLPGDDGVAELVKAMQDAGTIPELAAVWDRVRAAGLSAQTYLCEVKDARKRELSQPVDEADPSYVAEEENQ